MAALTPTATTGAAGPTLPAEPAWRMNGSKPGAGFSRLYAALYERSWPSGALDHVGVAMQAWRGAGRHNGLQHSHLLRYVQGPSKFPLSPTPAGGKRDGPPRWRSAPVLLAVARLIVRHGAELRQLLKLDLPIEDVPTMEMELAMKTERVQELEAENIGLQAVRNLAVDRARQSAKRAKCAAAAETEVKRKVSTTCKAEKKEY